uniref:17S U2 SnRNP complex component HTATSF1 n=1 Tax=Cacopsylla melanoneura TaxID=428564 RepID=A0A8D8ZS66_9HEMI
MEIEKPKGSEDGHKNSETLPKDEGKPKNENSPESTIESGDKFSLKDRDPSAVKSSGSESCENSLEDALSKSDKANVETPNPSEEPSVETPKSNVKSTIETTKSPGNTVEGDRSQYIHYEDEVAVYTDPQSRQQYTWDNENNEWTLRQIDYDFDGSNYYYTDKAGTKLKWDTVSNSWVPATSVPLVTTEAKTDDSDEEEYDENNARKTAPPIQRQDMSKGSYGYEGDTHTYTDATDGTVYAWDKEKNAWFPKIDDDFLARYQMSYGFVDNTSSGTEESKVPAAIPTGPDKSEVEVKSDLPVVSDEKSKPEEKPVPGQKRKPDPPKWFDIGAESTKVYVSNLPLDLTQEEFVEVMQKCGMVMKDLDTNQMKIRLYQDNNKMFKGDALCTYIKRESVDLALNILDGYEIRGKKMKVERAKFTMKGEAYDPNLKPKKKRKKDVEKLKKAQEKLFDWRPDKMRGERSKNETVIVIKNLFDPAQFDKEVTLILEYQQDLREECAKCGHVKKVVLHDKHPEGVAQVFFKEAEAADACKELLNERWFGQRRITAETWDGKTRYKVQETVEEREARLKKWETFLEEEDRKKKEAAENTADKKPEVKEDSKPSEDPPAGDENQNQTENMEQDDANDEDNNDDEGDNSDATKSSGESEGEE